MIKIDIKIGIDQTVEIECHIEVELSMDKTIEESNSMIKIMEMTLGEEFLEEHRIIEIRILEVDIEVTFGMITLVEVEVGLEIDSIWLTLEEMREALVRSRSGSRASTNRDRIICFKRREYDHFAKDCLNILDTEKELSEYIQQMINL